MTLWHLPEDGLGRNPYGQLLMRSLAAQGVRVVPVPYRHVFLWRALRERPDVLHFQFITPWVLPAGPSRSRWRAAVKGALFLLQVGLLRLAGCRLVWTAHNLVNHERRLAGFEACWNYLFTRLADLVIVHGEAARRAFLSRYGAPRRPDRVVVIPHPSYAGAYPADVSREAARRTLGIAGDPIVVLCLGQVRRYKGLVDAVRAFRALDARGGAVLWIAGEPVDAGVAADLEREAAGAADVRLRFEFLPAEDVAVLLAASDVVALPYVSILTSGAAVLATSFGRACVAPRLEALTEVLDERGAFFYDPADPAGLREALARAIAARADLPAMGRHNAERASAWSWTDAAARLTGLYRSIGAAPEGA
jgi:glycosyltransferase involved in cell wall biosynthesis